MLKWLADHWQVIVIVLLALAAVAAFFIWQGMGKRGRKHERKPVDITPTSADIPPARKRRPDLRVEYGDPAMQGTEVDDEPEINGLPSPLMVGRAQIIGERPDQEDYCDCSEWRRMDVLRRRGFLAVVADGIGGLSDGEVASRAAVEGAMATFNAQSNMEDPAGRVLDITAAAQNNVLAACGKTGSTSGCTFLCVLIEDMEMCFSSVGDSRIALYRGGVLLQLNREHVLGREVDEYNALTGERRAETPQRRKAITAYLGKRELRTIDRTLRPMQLVKDDKVLLMSDGVFNTLSDETLIAYLDMEPQAAADAIVRAVEDRGIQRQDNATIMIIGVK